MNITENLYRLNRYINILSQSSELSGARMQVLGLILNKNPVTLRQLCDIQQVKMPTMSKLVDELQSDSLVLRAQSKDDARQRWIVPTQKGIQKYEAAQQDHHQAWQPIWEEFSIKEQSQLEALLNRLNDLLSKKISNKP